AADQVPAVARARRLAEDLGVALGELVHGHRLQGEHLGQIVGEVEDLGGGGWSGHNLLVDFAANHARRVGHTGSASASKQDERASSRSASASRSKSSSR